MSIAMEGLVDQSSRFSILIWGFVASKKVGTSKGCEWSGPRALMGAGMLAFPVVSDASGRPDKVDHNMVNLVSKQDPRGFVL